MLQHQIRTYFRVLSSTWRTFGFGAVFLRWLLVPPFVFMVTHLCLALDRVFFPGYRKIEVKRPVFIIGHPRSGTTMLHKLLTQADDSVTFKGWHLFSPSILARFLLWPAYKLQLKRKRACLAPQNLGHEVSLTKVEEEEFLFVHNMDTQFLLTRSPLAFDEREYPELRFHDQQPSSFRRESALFFKSLLQRQMYLTGKRQVVAQLHFSTHRIKTLMEVFPDAHFIYLVRSPLEAIPSHLSLTWNSMEHQWGSQKLSSEALERFVARRYRYNVDLYRYFNDLLAAGEIPREKVMTLRYDELTDDVCHAAEKVISFTGIQVDQSLRKALEAQAGRQKHYVRKHQVASVESFGLTEGQIVSDLRFLFDRYGFERHQEARAA